MASRDDIKTGKLIYTDEIGWIDENHAKGDDAKLLWAQFLGETNISKFFSQYPSLMSTPLLNNYFIVDYSQSMGKAGYRAGKSAQWFVKKGLNTEQKKSIALGMMLYITAEFESLQSNWFYGDILRNDSGFSGEDLISNLLGFYTVIEPKNYRCLIKQAKKDKAYRIWDHYGSIGNYKNKELRPWIFPDPSTNPNSVPYKKTLPSYLRTITPCDINNSPYVINSVPTYYTHSLTPKETQIYIQHEVNKKVEKLKFLSGGIF